MVESDPHRFEKLAQGIADIPIDGPAAAPRTADEGGLRSALRVEVLDPHALWDARDGMTRHAIETAVPVIGQTAPIVVQAMAKKAATRIGDVGTYADGLRPSLPLAGDHRTIQLGAYSSQSAANAAWRDLSSGQARSVLVDLQPRFEQAEVKGRSVVRLKVSTPTDRVDTLCRTTGIDAPWCVSAG